MKNKSACQPYSLVVRIWDDQPGELFCISTKSPDGDWEDHFFKRSEFSEVPKFIAAHGDDDVYWCPHGFTKRKRRKEYAVPPKLLYADLDEAHPRFITPRPSIALRTSPGSYQGLWFTNEQLSAEDFEALNRRLTYAVDADKGGWKLTQVLRVPGTINHKAEYDAPTVTLLWNDGKEYSLDDIETLIGKDDAPSWGTFQRHLSASVRGAFRRGVEKGKRSDMEWKAIHELREAGATEDQIVAIMFKEQIKPRSERAIRTQVKKAFAEGSAKRGGKRPKKEASPNDGRLEFTNLQDVEPATYDWIWYPYLAKGEVTIFEGLPGAAKSYVAQIVAGYVATGKRLPSTRRSDTGAGRVVYFDFENDVAKATKPRLLNSDFTDLANIEVCDTPFTIDDEAAWDQIEDRLRKIEPALVVFDTLNQYIGKADIHRSNEAAQALGKFALLARDYDCSVVVVRHIRKDKSGPAMFAGQGNMALTGTARIVVSFGNVPDHPGLRAMCTTKVNIAPETPALSYRIEGLGNDRSRLSFEGHLEITSEDLIHTAPAKDTDIKKAEELLRDLLADGPRAKQAIETAAEARGISERTLRRASERLGVRKAGNRKTGEMTWSLARAKGQRRLASTDS